MAYSHNSRLTRKSQLGKYFQFIHEFSDNLLPVPCSATQAALYSTWLARDLKYRSILNYLSALNVFLKEYGETPLDYKNYILASTLKGIRRAKGDAPRQALPILPGMIIRIFSLLTLNPGHVAWRAALLCCFRGLLRKCHVTLSDSVLKRKDFRFHNWGMVIRITKSKTIQFSERELCIPIARCHNTQLCAVYWTELHFQQLVASPDAVAFRIPTAGGSSPLTYYIYEKTLKIFVERAGLDPIKFSSHSLRRGGCTFLAMSGASLEEIRTRGDWSSDAIFSYLKTPFVERVLHDIQFASLLSNMEVPAGLEGT